MVSGRAAGVKREGLPTYPPTWFARYTLSGIPAGKGSMIGLPQIKARTERLHELTINLGKEVVAQRHAEGLLLPLERRQYLNGLQTGLAELDAAHVVLAGVVKRMESARK
jgi:hypothetical protein